jgi:hypothetical protein
MAQQQQKNNNVKENGDKITNFNVLSKVMFDKIFQDLH